MYCFTQGPETLRGLCFDLARHPAPRRRGVRLIVVGEWRTLARNLRSSFRPLSGLTLISNNRIHFLAFLILFLLAEVNVLAQSLPTVAITGRVLDDSSGAALANADVFIANSTLGAPTNDQGRFVIKGVPLGTHELVASRVGYLLVTRIVRITDSTQQNIDFRLKPRQLVVGAVEILAPEPVEWKKDLAKFKEFFLGEGPNAAKTVLLNPEVLSFTKDPSGRFEAQASQPLRIDNWALGYQLQLELVTFVISDKWLTYAWKALYRNLYSSGVDQDKEWALRRLRTYKGSLRHFLASLAVGTADAQGFQMFRVKRFDASRIRWPMTNEDLITPGPLPNEKFLAFDDFLEVEYSYGPRRTSQNAPFSTSETNPYVSWLQLTSWRSTISTLGNYSEPFSIKVTGWWAGARIPDELPFDFIPAN